MNYIDEIKLKTNIKENFEMKNSKFHKNRLLISDNFVIKLYNNKRNYENEIYCYENLKNEKMITELIFKGNIDDLYFIVLKRLNACTLFKKWKALKTDEKNIIIENIAEDIKKINMLKTDNNNYEFKKQILLYYKQNLKENKIDEELKEYIVNVFTINFDKMEDKAKRKLIYSDFHFNNILIDNNNNIFFIDFEEIKMAPLELQLQPIIHMCDNPSIEANYSDKVIPEDYNMVVPKIMDTYKELKTCNFKFINMYNMLYDWRAVNHNKANKEILKKYL